MSRFLLFLLLALPTTSLFCATETSEEYISRLENEVREDISGVNSMDTSTHVTKPEATKQTSSVLETPLIETTNDLAGYFTTIPEKEHSLVSYYIQYYTTFGKKSLEDFLDRFRDYFPVIQKYAQKKDLPLEVALIPLVESGSRSDVVKNKRAGMWLLSEEIGSIYGLHIGEYLDERLDLEKSSDAALSYFASLLRAFNNDWDFALTAFNGGGTLLQKEMRNLNITDFWDIFDKKSSISSDSLEYVPKFYALLTILKNPSQYHINVPSMSESNTVSFSELPLSRSGVAFKDIARLTNVSMEKIVSLNPQLSRQYTVAGSTLYIPANTQYLMKSRIRVAKATRLPRFSYKRGDGTNFAPAMTLGQGVSVAKKSSRKKNNPSYYRVKSKDTLYSIAKRMNVSVSTLLAQNKNVSSNGVLKIGTLLKVAKANATPGKSVRSQKISHYKVKSGDTLYSIAKNYNIPVSKVMSKNGASIKPGDDLLILNS